MITTFAKRLTIGATSRSSGPYHPSDPAAASFFGYSPTAAGTNVDEYTAMNYAAVWAATCMIAEPLATLPRVLLDDNEVVKDHDLYGILQDEANEESDAISFFESRQMHVSNWGNGLAEIERSQSGKPLALWPLSPRDVTPDRSKSGALVYRVRGDGSDVVVPIDRMFHVAGPSPDGIWGYNVIRTHREAIGLGVAEERFGATWFGNGSHIKGMLTLPGNPQKPARDEMRRSIESDHQGANRANRIGMIWGGATWNPDVGLVAPEEAQFLQSREFQRGEIALIYRLPLSKMGVNKSVSYGSAEQFAEDYVRYTLRPCVERWESQIRRKLLMPNERRKLQPRFLMDELLRGDLAKRTMARMQQFMNGAITIDEWRKTESMPPTSGDGGDKHFRPSNIVPLDTPAPEPKPAMPPRGASEKIVPPEPDESAKQQRAALLAAQRGVFLDALGRLCRKECAAVRRAAATPAEFLAKLEAFHGPFFGDLIRSLAPALLMKAAILPSRETPTQEATALADAWIAESKAELLSAAEVPASQLAESIGGLCDKWEATRPAALAAKLLEQELCS